MLINDKEKYIIDYYQLKEHKSEATVSQICENILKNQKTHPKDENYLYDLNKWDEYKDNILRQLVLFYNFDFKQISNVFDKICKVKREIDEYGDEIPVYSEKILRYHWSFLHARRFFGEKTGEDYYILNKGESVNEDINKDIVKKVKKEETIDINNEVDKNLLNTINVNSLKKENDMENYFDKLLNQKMDKETTKLFEMELNENRKENNFPVSVDKNTENINVESIIKNIKEKNIEDEKNKRLEEESKQKEEDEIEYDN